MNTRKVKQQLERTGFIFTDVETPSGQSLRISAHAQRVPATGADATGSGVTVSRAGEEIAHEPCINQGTTASAFVRMVERAQDGGFDETSVPVYAVGTSQQRAMISVPDHSFEMGDVFEIDTMGRVWHVSAASGTRTEVAAQVDHIHWPDLDAHDAVQEMHDAGTLTDRLHAAGYDDGYVGKVWRTHQRGGLYPADVYEAIISAYTGLHA